MFCNTEVNIATPEVASYALAVNSFKKPTGCLRNRYALFTNIFQSVTVNLTILITNNKLQTILISPELRTYNEGFPFFVFSVFVEHSMNGAKERKENKFKY